MRHHPKRGFTLTELAIVLGIIGTILGAIWVAASRVYNSQKNDKAVQEIMAIATGVKSLFPSGNAAGSAGATLSSILVNNGSVSGDMVTSCTGPGMMFGSGWGGSAGCITSPWQTQIIASTQSGWGGTPSNTSRFEIQIYQLTTAQCSNLLATLVPQAIASGLVEVYADNGLAVQTVTSATPSTTYSICSGNVVLQFSL